jgi:hypothetical protein
MKKHITLTLVLIITLLATSAMAEVKTVNLIAGQNIVIGEVIAEDFDGMLYVTYKITDPDWVLLETHLEVTDRLSDIPRTKKLNPIPGKFKYCMEYETPVTEYTYEIDLGYLGYPLCIASHAEVQHVDGSEEGAWGEGWEFSTQRGWAMWFLF